MTRFDGTRSIRPPDSRFFTPRFWVTALVLEILLFGACATTALVQGSPGVHDFGLLLLGFGGGCWALTALTMFAIARFREPFSGSSGTALGGYFGGRFIWLDDGDVPPFLPRLAVQLFLDAAPLILAGLSLLALAP